MDSVSSVEFSEVPWTSEPKRGDFELQFSPEKGPKQSLSLHLSTSMSISRKQSFRASTRSLDGESFNSSPFSVSKNFKRAVSFSFSNREVCPHLNVLNLQSKKDLGSSFQDLQAKNKWDNTLNEQKDKAGNLEKAGNGSFSKQLADWNLDLARGATNAKVNTARDKKGQSPEQENKSGKQSRPGTSRRKSKSMRISGSGKSKREEPRSSELTSPGLGRNADGTTTKEAGSPERALRRAQSTRSPLGEPSKRSSRGRYSASRGNTTGRRVARNSSMSNIATLKSSQSGKRDGEEVDGEGRPAMRRTKSLDTHEVYTEIAPTGQAAPKQPLFDDYSKPYSAEGLARVDIVLVDNLWSDQSSVVITALCELRRMCRGSDAANTVKILQAAGCATILGVFRKWHHNVGIQREGLRLLAICLKKRVNEDFILMVVRLGGLRVVTSVMEKFAADESVQEHACVVLHALVSAKNKSPSVIFVTELKGLPLLLRMLEEYPTNPVISQEASFAFCSMARFGDLRRRLEVGLDVVRKVVDVHGGPPMDVKKVSHPTARGA